MYSAGSRKTASEFDEMPKEEAKRRLEILAKGMDENEDGFVDETELTNWVERSMVSLDNEEVTERLGEMDTNGDKLVTMKEKDANKDGAIDLKEFLGEMADNEHSDWHTVEKDRFMAEYDTDGDGVLRGDEVRRWLVPDLKAVAQQEATHLVNGADKDKVS
ncbi:EF hand [Teladorsagia circumcincta]|uniref:EF hand n=1 Tax=Teladorsagia circumcincta TaxID=45464 RepID=A0A2G9UH83_TELCI|nr:EF hand [Teladorsagia circumcincta]